MSYFFFIPKKKKNASFLTSHLIAEFDFWPSFRCGQQERAGVVKKVVELVVNVEILDKCSVHRDGKEIS